MSIFDRVRADGWINLITKLGDASRDKRESAGLTSHALDPGVAAGLYSASDMASRCVDALPDEALRRGFNVKIDDDRDTAEELDEWCKAVDLFGKVNKADKMRRTFGGSAILLGVNDGGDLEQLREPLRPEAVQSVDALSVLDARELIALDYENNVLSPEFGLPTRYQMIPRLLGTSLAKTSFVEVHASRVVRFSGAWAKREDLLSRQGWGMSTLDVVWRSIRDFDSVYDSGAHLALDFSQAIFKLQGLRAALAADKEQLIVRRFQLMDTARSVLRAILLDADGEDFERKATPMTGFPELMDRFANRVAAAARMPVALLMGQAPAGLNATGAADTRFFYDQIAAHQTRELQPQVERILAIKMQAKDSPTGGKLPERWCVEWPALWQLDDTQNADVRAKLATADAAMIDRGVVSAAEVRASRYSPDGLAMDITVDETNEAAYAATPAPEDLALEMAGANAASAAKAQDTALNGAQVTSAVEIVQSVADGRLPRDAGVNMLAEFFNLDPARAEKIMGSVGKGFKPEKPEPVLAPQGAAPKPPPEP